MAFISLLLALVTQLYSVGWILTIDICGIAIGAKRRWRKWTAYWTTQLLVFAIVMGLLFHLSSASSIHSVRTEINDLHRIQAEIERFRQSTGKYPGDLAELKQSGYRDGIQSRYWGHDFVYEKTGTDAFRVGTMGRDGKVGGAGWNADWWVGESSPYDARLPIRQFVVLRSTTSLCLAICIPLSLVGAILASFLKYSANEPPFELLALLVQLGLQVTLFGIIGGGSD